MIKKTVFFGPQNVRKSSDISRAVAAITNLPSSTLPDSPFIRALGTPAAQNDYVQETNWDAQREKACVNTYAPASASQICLQNICGQQQNFPMAGPSFGSKSGPQNGAQAKT